jgi:hypothetical protein
MLALVIVELDALVSVLIVVVISGTRTIDQPIASLLVEYCESEAVATEEGTAPVAPMPRETKVLTIASLGAILLGAVFVMLSTHCQTRNLTVEKSERLGLLRVFLSDILAVGVCNHAREAHADLI